MQQSVHGDLTDAHTRCEHYHSPLDIIALKFKCCDLYYACIHCHEKYAGHAPDVWKKAEHETKAILCGDCGYELTITEYFNCNYQCPKCGSAFNPKCKGHEGYYFEQ